MTGHHLGTFGGNAEELAGTGRHIAVAGAMETIATDAVLLVKLVGNGIHISLGRHGLMESCVEDTHLGKSRHQFLHGVHTLQVGGIVERSQIGALFKGLKHLVGKNH